MTSIKYNGSCVCGQTTYEAFDLADVSYCHCEQCRKMTGHYMAACQVKRDKIKIKGEIKWFYTHKGSRHGFCDNCGAHMFWQNDTQPTISVTAGSLEDAKNLGVGTIYSPKRKVVITKLIPMSHNLKVMAIAK